jgi:multidrug resistance protein, MATE family
VSAKGTLSRAESTRRLATLAWPVLLGQLSVIGFGTLDTLLIARYASADLAALAVGGAAYFTTFVGLMGVVMAIGPLAGQAFGAGRLDEAGDHLHQASWLALAATVPGLLLLAWPEPYLWLARLPPELEAKTRTYLIVLALALPASLLFAAWRGFNTAVSRPRIVMGLQLGALAAKVPLSILLIHGAPSVGLPALGLTGCAVATAIVMWGQLAAAVVITRRDDFYAKFGLHRRGLHRPNAARLRELVKLGVPMGATLLIEVSGFTMMAIFIARLGATPVAGHQIAVNVVSILFMVPLALSNAAMTLVSQSVGARELAQARQIGWHAVQIGLALAVGLGALVALGREGIVRLYTSDEAVVAAALPLLAWLAVFHIADAAQTLAAFVLRAWKIATGPMVIYAVSLWGVGLGGGYLLAFDVLGGTPRWLTGAPGYWMAATVGLVVGGTALIALLAWAMRQRAAEG